MLPISKIIISDTSCLILLIKINELDLLNKFSNEVVITSIIKNELNINLPLWIKVEDPKNLNYQNLLELELDKGEASAIALMLEKKDAILLIDDLKGRKVSEKLNLKYSGTLGLILKAKQAGIIPSVKSIIEKIKSTNFRFSEQLIDEIIKQANE